LQLSFCYKVGFGTPQDHAKSQQWEQEVEDYRATFGPGESRPVNTLSHELERSRHPREVYESDLLHRLTEGGYLDTMDYVHEYRRDGVLEVAETHTRYEMEGMEGVLHGYHPAVLSLSRILATILTATGHFQSAATLVAARAKDLQQIPQSFWEPRDRMLDGPIRTIVTYTTRDDPSRKVEAAAMELFLGLELQDRHAAISQEQGTPRVAEAQYRHIIELQDRLFGPKNSALMIGSLAGLAMSLVEQGQFRPGHSYCHHALTMAEASLGNKHPNTLRIRNNLAVAEANLENYNKAETFLESIHSDMLGHALLGEHHEYTLVVLCNRISLMHLQGRHEEAVKLALQAREDSIKFLGESHLVSQTCNHNLAVVYTALGGYEKAKKHLEECVATWEVLLGSDHEATRQGYSNLCRLRDEGMADRCGHDAKDKNQLLLRPILRQLAERVTAARGMRLLDSAWVAELRSRYVDMAKKSKEKEAAM